MATIRCEHCGRYIMDSDRNCLYCNTPNKQYKEKNYDSPFGSFSSFGSSDFGSSFSTGSFSGTDFSSSFAEKKEPTDFGVGKDFADVEHEKVTEPTPIKSRPEWHMSSYFDTPSDFEPPADTQASIVPPSPKYETAATPKHRPVSTPPVDYKKKLTQFRQANGYGEYSSAPSSRDTYNPPKVDFRGKPIDPTNEPVYRDIPPRRESPKKHSPSSKVVSIIFLYIFLQVLIRILFFFIG